MKGAVIKLKDDGISEIFLSALIDFLKNRKERVILMTKIPYGKVLKWDFFKVPIWAILAI